MPPSRPLISTRSSPKCGRSAPRLAPLDSQERFESLGVDVFRGEATFLSPEELIVGDEKLRARHFVIAAGSHAAIPPAIGASRVPYFTNETIFDELKEKPESLLIVGGGPIGCELGQMFARLGVKVTLVQRGSRLLKKEDPAVSEFVQATLEAEGVRILTRFEVEEAKETAGGVTLRGAIKASRAARCSSQPGADRTLTISISEKRMFHSPSAV